jgi:hypothetical protein
MLTIYEIDDLGQWTGASRDVDDLEGWETSWTLAPKPPEPEMGQRAVWASNSWRLRDWIDPRVALAISDEDAPPETP